MNLLSNDLLRSLASKVEWKSLRVIQASCSRCYSVVTPHITNDNYWRQRIISLTGHSYDGPFPFTLAVCLEYITTKGVRVKLYRIKEILASLNIEEFYEFFFRTQLGYEWPVEELVGDFYPDEVDSHITIPSLTSLLLDRYKSDGTISHPYATLSRVVPQLPLDKQAKVTLRILRWCDPEDVYQYRYKDLPLGKKDPATLKSYKVNYDDLLCYAEDPETTRRILINNPSAIEACRLAWLHGLNEVLTPECRAVYAELSLDIFPHHHPTTPDEFRTACQREYGVSSDVYPELQYNLFRGRNTVMLQVLLALGLEELTGVYLTTCRQGAVTALIARDRYDLIRKYDIINAVPTTDGRVKGEHIGQHHLAALEEKAPDLLRSVMEKLHVLCDSHTLAKIDKKYITPQVQAFINNA